jgi:hypothetical protein
MDRNALDLVVGCSGENLIKSPGAVILFHAMQPP